MLIGLRNAMMAGKRLPYDAEVEYLESTGTQWIDTGIVADEMFGFEITCAFLADGCVYGTINGTGDIGTARVDWARYQFGRRYNVSGSNTLFYGFNNIDVSSWIKIALDCAAVHTYRVSDSEFFVDGERKVYGTSGSFSANPFYLFASYTATGYSFAAKSRLYAAKLYSNGVLVRDFIPVRKGNVGYMYDRVSGKLFGNDGTGDFVLGPDVVPVEYIENVASSYINTEFKADNACKFEIDFENKKTGSGYNPWLFGSRNGSASAVDKSCVFLGYNSGTSYAMMGSATPTFNQGLVVSGRHTLTMSLSEGVGIDGVTIATYTPSEQAQIYTNTHPNALFNMWNGSSLNNFFIGRVYSFKVLKNGVPQIDFRSVRIGSGSTWEGAMMDVLTRRIYRNAGTGAFGYGNDI